MEQYNKTVRLRRMLKRVAEKFDAEHILLQQARAKAGKLTDPRGETFPATKDYDEETLMKEIMWFVSEAVRCKAERLALETGNKTESFEAVLGEFLVNMKVDLTGV